MSAVTATTSPHVFVADFPAEPGYRPRCTVCGQERHGLIPAPRAALRPADVTGGQW